MFRPLLRMAFVVILITCMIAIAIHNDPGMKAISHTPNIQLPTLTEETP